MSFEVFNSIQLSKSWAHG